jgi:hypothetical protein
VLEFRIDTFHTSHFTLGELFKRRVLNQGILKSEFPEAVVIEHVESLMRGVYCDRTLSDMNSSIETGHCGEQGARVDNEDNKSSDGGNPWILLAIMENSIDKVTSYSKVAWQNATVEGNSF